MCIALKNHILQNTLGIHIDHPSYREPIFTNYFGTYLIFKNVLYFKCFRQGHVCANSFYLNLCILISYDVTVFPEHFLGETQKKMSNLIRLLLDFFL